MPLRRIRRFEIPTSTRELAKFLIGKVLVRENKKGRMCGRIVETEAYGVGDAASHSFRGMTARNRSMFLGPGHAYVYFIYGTWFALNVSSEPEGTGGAALIRALEVLDGMEQMRERRPNASDQRLASGPGCLTVALAIDKALDGVDLCARGPLWLGEMTQFVRPPIATSVRIGISKEAHRRLRFFIRHHASVSGPKWMHTASKPPGRKRGVGKG